MNHSPIKYLYCSLNFEDLVALYRVADVCVVTSTRDGMNLVSYEFIACQSSKKGVLILSEFAGAAKSMNGAIIVNPWNIEELVDAYHEAITMDAVERASNHNKLFRYITKYTAAKWGSSFVHDLERLKIECSVDDRELRPPVLDLTTSTKRLIFLDFDKSLCGETLPCLSINEEASAFLDKIRKNSDIILYLMSARSHSDLENIFEINEFGIIAEQGCLVRLAATSNKEWIVNTKASPLNEDEQLKSLFEEYSESTPGSFFEINEFNANWFYHDKDSFYGSAQALELSRQVSKCIKSDYKLLQKNGILSLMPRDLKLMRILEDIASRHQVHDPNMEVVFICNESREVFPFELPNDKNMKTIKLNCPVYEDLQSLKFNTDIDKAC